LDYIGRLLAFAFVTNTRAVGKIGNNDQRFPAYELWFSFTSEENKKLSWTSCAKIDTPILTRSRH
jgi:hypothetical protein